MVSTATRNTTQRRIVEEHLRMLANHPTADQVFESVHAIHPRVGKATVYRLLNKMAEEGTVLRVRINNGPDCFDHNTHRHHHVRCVECGRVDDVDLHIDEGVDEVAAETSGFRVLGHSLQFDGLCPVCAAKRDEEARPASA